MNEYEELDSIAIPEAIPAFGLEAGDTGCIVSKWVGEWEGLSGTYLLVDIPKEDGTSYGSASVLVEASGGDAPYGSLSGHLLTLTSMEGGEQCRNMVPGGPLRRHVSCRVRCEVVRSQLAGLEVLGEGGWLKALKLEDYDAPRKARPGSLQQSLFPYHEAWG